MPELVFNEAEISSRKTISVNDLSLSERKEGRLRVGIPFMRDLPENGVIEIIVRKGE